jgi:nicotinate phosphoribosyltransferase
MTRPIITSLLDLDLYKLTMMQFAWRRYRDVRVTYELTNRTKKVRVADFVSPRSIKDELDAASELKFTDEEISYLASSPNIPTGLFKPDFLEHLSRARLSDIAVGVSNGNLTVKPSGLWHESIPWETLILSIENELYYREVVARSGLSIDQVCAEGDARLSRKIELLSKHPDLIRIIEFGTRRRFSKEWQQHVVTRFIKELGPIFAGTSNVALARELNIAPKGTFAHEMYMVLSRLFGDSDKAIRGSHSRVLREWWDEYGASLSIALTDTYGSDFFFKDFTPEQARLWSGLRHDSGDPFAFGEQTISFYQSLGIDPREKKIFFSDGLDAETIVDLATRFGGRIYTPVPFGWGTNATNDLGFPSLSLVVKATRVNGLGTVKLSDNLAKAMGSPEDIERFKQIFDYRNTERVECQS